MGMCLRKGNREWAMQELKKLTVQIQRSLRSRGNWEGLSTEEEIRSLLAPSLGQPPGPS